MSSTQLNTLMFAEFQEYFDEEQDVKEEIRVVVRELEQRAREIQTLLHGIHHANSVEHIFDICVKAREMFTEIRTHFAKLGEKVPQDQYYRFHDHWRFVTQRLCFLVALIGYLDSETLATKKQAAELLGVKVKREDGFHVDLDDFLMGLLQLASELSRLAVNSVTAGDYGRPIRIAKFVTDVDSGFRLLNLKNDALRKRFDGLKYDLKKVEEVVYDITIRGLRPKDCVDSATAN